jgi:hypothetical protein
MNPLVLASLALALVHGAPSHRPALACNMAAFTPAQRSEHDALAKRVWAQVRSRRELRDGWAFELPAGAFDDAARWVSLERRCCPFFAFRLELAAEGGALWLHVTGGQGVKEFVRIELGL